jgi:NAD(P)H-flavin reductase
MWSLIYLFNRDNILERLIEDKELNLHELAVNMIGVAVVSIIFLISGTIRDKRILIETNNRVISNLRVSDNHFLISIKLAKPIDFKPGQYINLFIDKEKKPYTPIYYKDNTLRFFIKSYESGSFSNRLTSLYSKDKVIYAKGGFGNKLYLSETDNLICNDIVIQNRNIIMICNGTAITPFYSILTNLHPKTKYNFKLFASFRTRDDAYLIHDVKEYTEAFVASENKKLSQIIVHSIISDHEDPVVLICGTVSFVAMVQDTCKELKQRYHIF